MSHLYGTPLFSMVHLDQLFLSEIPTAATHFRRGCSKMQGGGEFEKYSVYMDNVDCSCTSKDVKSHFDCCRIVNRITILTNEFGNPQGYAYVEFIEADSVDKSLLLNGSNLRSGEITVSNKKKRSRWNNNSSRAFRHPLQQELATNSRSAGNSNITSRPNHNHPI